MENTTKEKSPADLLLYLLSSATLYYCLVWLLVLWYQYIDTWFPSVSTFGQYGYEAGISSAVRGALASLIIVFPVYIGTTHYLNVDLEKNPEKKNLRIRKWLTYVTLFLTAVAQIINLVVLVFNLLDGDFTTPFLLKCASIFIASSLVFGYYFFELRRDAGRPAPARLRPARERYLPGGCPKSKGLWKPLA